MPPMKIGVGAVISAIMFALGVFVAVRLLVRPDNPLTGAVSVDIAFALFFMARGALYFWTIHRRSRG